MTIKRLPPDDPDAEALHFAAGAGDVDEIVALVREGFDVKAFDELSYTPLHYAAEAGHEDAVRALLVLGADVNAHDEDRAGDTPLGVVAQECTLAMAKLLLDAGADPTIPGWMQITPLHRAGERKRGEGPAVHALMLEATRR